MESPVEVHLNCRQQIRTLQYISKGINAPLEATVWCWTGEKSRMEDVLASSGYVPIGSLSAAVDGSGRAAGPAAPSKRPQYFAAFAGKVPVGFLKIMMDLLESNQFRFNNVLTPWYDSRILRGDANSKSGFKRRTERVSWHVPEKRRLLHASMCTYWEL